MQRPRLKITNVKPEPQLITPRQLSGGKSRSSSGGSLRVDQSPLSEPFATNRARLHSPDVAPLRPITSADSMPSTSSGLSGNSVTRGVTPKRYGTLKQVDRRWEFRPPTSGSRKLARASDEIRELIRGSLSTRAGSGRNGHGGAPVIVRTAEEKLLSPERLDLNRQNFQMCPILEGESQLRLLNYQHNQIRVIENISCLRRLIFLDLYDNHIGQMSGLENLVSLRVLMLGKNRICKIEGLDNLLKLDVLDLHSNDIRSIENLSHLSLLRVLNLASNHIEVVSSVAGLVSLTELNLRRNNINTVQEADQLINLQRLFLSFNNISFWEDIAPVQYCPSLCEISLDGNPFSRDEYYRNTVVRNIPQLKQLDLKRVSPSAISIWLSHFARREEERRSAGSANSSVGRLPMVVETSQTGKHDAIRLNQQQPSPSSLTPEPASGPMLELDAAGCITVNSQNAGPTETKDGYVSMGNLGIIERPPTGSSNVVTMKFTTLQFSQLQPLLFTIRNGFPALQTVELVQIDLSSYRQVNALAHLRRLDSLTIQDCPLNEFSHWRHYVIWRLVTPLSISQINGTDVTCVDEARATQLFSGLQHTISRQTPPSHLAALQSELGKKVAVSAVDNSKMLTDLAPQLLTCGPSAKPAGGSPSSNSLAPFVSQLVAETLSRTRREAHVHRKVDSILRRMILSSLEKFQPSRREENLSLLQSRVLVAEN